MSKESALHIVEIGPSNVLSGLAKRHLKDVKISQVSSSNQINY
jgi:[acyl-carrier-protein] S-malonyltransferase